jgi:hypothetical protein
VIEWTVAVAAASWEELRASRVLAASTGIGVDWIGNVYIASSGNRHIVTGWGDPAHSGQPFFDPEDVAVASGGTVYEVEFNKLWKLPGS